MKTKVSKKQKKTESICYTCAHDIVVLHKNDFGKFCSCECAEKYIDIALDWASETS